MIKMGVKMEGIDDFIKSAKGFIKAMEDPELHLKRAKRFRRYTIDLVKSGQAGIKPISSATRIISGEHNPEFLTGGLLEHMETKKGEKHADAGYFDESAKKVPGKNINYAKLAVLQHTGYRIPLTGEKGRKVRAWLAMHGVGVGMGKMDVKNNKWGHQAKWIIVPPRPFMDHSAEKYVDSDIDTKIVMDFVDKILKKQHLA